MHMKELVILTERSLPVAADEWLIGYHAPPSAFEPDLALPHQQQQV